MPVLLETARLVLRSFTADDVDHLYDLNGDPDVMWFLTGGEPTPRDEVRDRIIPFFLSFYEKYTGLGFWAAETRTAGDFLGWFHLRPAEGGDVDLGYRLRKEAWNQGYATGGFPGSPRQVLSRVGRAARGRAHHGGQPGVPPGHGKCGLRLTRSHPSTDLPAIPGAEQGEVEYALTRQEWQAARRPPA